MFTPVNAPERRSSSSKSATGKVLCVLDYVSNMQRSVTVAEIGVALGLSRSQAHRIVASLTAEGALRRHPGSGRIIFGPRVTRVAIRMLGGSSVRPLWHIILRQLVDEVGETFNLVVYDQCFGTYFDRIEANWPLKVRFNVGSTVPLHCTAGGKLYLSLLPEIERNLVLESLPLTPFTNRTFTERRIFEKHLTEIAARDYSTNQEEFFPRLIAVGVPVRDAGKRLLATLVMPASMSRMSLVEAETYVPRMRLAAARLGSVLEMEEASFDRAAAF